MATVAILDSVIGQLHIYDIQAFESLINSSVMHASAVKSSSGSTQQELLDGFNLEQWAAYGRHKSTVASRVCKENGKLKAMLETCGSRSICSPAKDVIDPLTESDPWRGCSYHIEHNARTRPCESVWSSWNPSLVESSCKDFDSAQGTPGVVGKRLVQHFKGKKHVETLHPVLTSEASTHTEDFPDVNTIVACEAGVQAIADCFDATSQVETGMLVSRCFLNVGVQTEDSADYKSVVNCMNELQTLVGDISSNPDAVIEVVRRCLKILDVQVHVYDAQLKAGVNRVECIITTQETRTLLGEKGSTIHTLKPMLSDALGISNDRFEVFVARP